MPVITAPALGARAPWMQHALLVAALACAGQPGASEVVAGAAWWPHEGLVVLGL